MARKTLRNGVHFTGAELFFPDMGDIFVQAVHLGFMPDAELVERGGDLRAQGWDVVLFRHDRQTYLQIGCQTYASREEALAHVDAKGRSKRSKKVRPHRKALIDYASAVAKTNGWKW